MKNVDSILLHIIMLHIFFSHLTVTFQYSESLKAAIQLSEVEVWKNDVKTTIF